MSHPSLQQVLETLFVERTPQSLELCLNHPAFSEFQDAHSFKIPHEELVQAFIHTSFAHEYKIPHQEQLEFLGDSVLQLILTDELYHRFPQEKEGRLSKLRSQAVNEKSLAMMGRALGLQELILVGKGEFKRRLFEQDTAVADSFEALLAQVYRFQGLEFARAWVLKIVEMHLPETYELSSLETFDVKSRLQEMSLAKYKKLPVYTSESSGTSFEVRLWINDKLVGSGLYPSKKIGEKELASFAIKEDLI